MALEFVMSISNYIVGGNRKTFHEMASKHPASIDETLTCPICLEILKAPKILECLHRFCTKCLSEFVRKCTSTQFGCPVCRQEFVLPADGVENMKGDFVMEEILDRYKLEKELQQKKKERVCNSCDELKTSEAFCPDCGGFLCNNCYEPHKTMKSLKSHVNLILLEDLQTGNISSHVENLRAVSRAPKCRQHADQILYFNCVTCNTLICPVCAPILHKTHEIEEVKTTFSRLLRQLDDLRKTTEEGYQSIQSSLQKVGELTTKVEEETEDHLKQIRLVMKTKEEEIIAEKEDLIAKIESDARNRLEDLHRFSEDSCTILNTRKAATAACLTGIRDKIQVVVKRNETIIKNSCLFNEKSDMWSAILSIPDAVRAFDNAKPDDCPVFPVLNEVAENGVQFYDTQHTGNLPNSPFENGTWKIQHNFCLKECEEHLWILSSVSFVDEDCAFVTSLCRSNKYSISKVNMNDPFNESRQASISPIDINSDTWTTFPPSYVSVIAKESTLVGVGNLIYTNKKDEVFKYKIGQVSSHINALATCEGSEGYDLFVAIDNKRNLIRVTVQTLERIKLYPGGVINILGMEPIQSVDTWQRNLLVCDGHRRACALDRNGTFLHEYSHGVTKRIPLLICADRFGSVFILQKLMMSSINIKCVEEYTFEGEFVTSWTVPDNVTLMTTVRCSPQDDGVVVGTNNGEITCYQRTEHGKYLTSLMKAEAESQ